MRVDRRLLIALALSLLAHVLIAGAPGWRLPFLDEPEAGAMLEAYLTPPPAPAVPPAPPRPQPEAKAKPPQPQSQPQPLLPPAPAPVIASDATPAPPPVVEAAPPVTEAAPAAVKHEIAWPREGRIRFAVMRGEGERAMRIGEATHAWRHDGETYHLRAAAETTGLVALFRDVRIVQTSEGAISAEGLLPHDFAVERKGRLAEGAHFDWSAGTLTLTRGGQPRREAALAAGAQDLLSQFYQIGLVGVAARVELMVATGKNYGRYAYEAVGGETLDTPFGALRVWRVRTPAVAGEQAMELWLAQDYGNLPVRIRFTDRDGEVFEQNAVELEIDGAPLAMQTP
ncbi:MAG: DUF3108 domain-containing protein [Zoogloeaceae bacterium]|jgi:hypothetical protein|nr:DUF3108 domain-containing protein [Zoogloeaceae bacterium]